jgi:tripartite-type tricarboxylate transporter receptor subunit TctC
VRMQRAVIRHNRRKHHEFASHSQFHLPEDRMLAVAGDRDDRRRAGSTGELSGQAGTDHFGAPGGAIDTNLRIIAEGLSQKWARQVVIENRPGAGGAISATAAAEAAPNGYTIYAPASSMFPTIPGKAPNLPLKLPHDFTAIGITVVQPQSIGINPKLGINSLPELIAQAKKKPGSISYAVTGVGRLTHLTGELLQIRANIKLQMVPYTGGPVNSSPA